MRVQDLVDAPRLRIHPVNNHGRDRPVRAAQVVAWGDGTQKLEAHAVLLMSLQGRPPAQTTDAWLAAELARCAAAQVAAIVCCLDGSEDHVPPAMARAAERSQFPLLEVPASTSTNEVEQYVALAMQREELHELQRSTDILTALLHAAGGADPLNAVVEQLAHIGHGAAFVYDLSGKIIHSAGTGPARLIWSEHASVSPESGFLRIGRWTAATRRIARGPDVFLLALASQQEGHVMAVAAPALEASAQLFRTISGINSAAWTNQQHYGQSLLSLLRNGVQPSRESRLMDQLAPYGFATGDALRFVVLGGETEVSHHHHQDLLSLGLDLGLGLVLAEHYDFGTHPLLHALVTDASPLTGWLNEAGRTHVVGVSEPFHSLTDTPGAYQEAETARAVGERRRAPGRGYVVRMDEVGLSTWLKARHAGPQVAARVAREIAPLKAHPQLQSTLVAWLRHRMDVQATARAMFVHPNSIRYRLHRCEELLDRSFQDPAALADVYLALEDDVFWHPDLGANGHGSTL
ncbi:helix-turn-helix domain-containing protein [Kocuria sp. cx-116]|uniref:PucR family transcriptional regulator n=1 Tax=Kocuria sp. cx-116 TaxID=2771378 RepID=UPI001682F7A1|nr:helix-turn-helix domain-containing protein [Kocuria sp. cx-116]MBD2761060.1 helix-turn-helix domain-containing protein [Kocuria sp. cx-116]